MKEKNMIEILIFILGLALCVQAFIGLSFFISSIQEREKRATVLAGLQFIGMLFLVVLFFVLNAYDFFDSGFGFGIMILALVVGAVGAILLFTRIGVNKRALQGTKGYIVGEVKQWDERDIQFSNMMRMMYMMKKKVPPPGAPADGPSDAPPGPPPEMMEMLKNITDDEMNTAGLGPLGPADDGPGWGVIDGAGAVANVAMTNASATMPSIWGTPDRYSPSPKNNRTTMSPEEASMRIKGFVKNLGAVSVGIAELDQKWVYSHRGVSGVHLKEWGKPVKCDHKYAVIFTEEMAFETVGAAPHTPIIIESMKNYAKGAFVGAQVANFISNLGYSSRVNHNTTYDANMVPLAVDAGLGELSRMGYLITKEYGPRVRLSGVTTDLPLIPDKPVDIGVQHFCDVCKKCANTCPSDSIPQDEPAEVNGSMRWKLNDETCFGYWQQVGTDCGICMRVCPWSHARTLPHRLIVWAVSRNKYSRILFNWLDDVFYGKHPRPKNPPEWANFKASLIDRPPTQEEIMALSGTWRVELDTPMGKDYPLIILEAENGALKGRVDGKMGKPRLEKIRIDGNNFSFKAAQKGPAGMMSMEFSGTLDGDSMSGTFFGPMGPTPFTGERQK